MSVNPFSSLCELLQNHESKPVQDSCLQAWRVSAFQTQMITLGIKNNKPGSVYTPPAYKKSQRAEVFLVWEDGKCSKAKVQSPIGEETAAWDRELLFWRMSAFEDPYARNIPSPQPLPRVDIASDEIKAIIENQGYLFEEQRRILTNRPPAAQTNANIMAYWGENTILTSSGIDVKYKESRYAISWSFDSLISQGAAQRYLVLPEKWQELWDESIDRYNIVNKSAEQIENKTQVILSPQVVEQMIEQYILANFNGENILEGQSKFNQEDFEEKKKCFDQGLSLAIDPLQAQHWASYLLTTEGIPAMQTELVKNGELSSPYLNVKEAFRWGKNPTALPVAVNGIKLNHLNQIPWSQLLQGTEDGILILNVLGLHTQNPVTGNFSLAAPASLRIKNGILTGKTDVRISGNFWDILQSSHGIYGESDLDDFPYLLAPCAAENV